MVKTSASKTKTGPRTDPEAVERRRMQNRLAQRKRRQKRAQMAREEKERQQCLQAAQAASQLTFINDSYPLPVPAYSRQPKSLPHVMTKNYFDYKPPQVEDVFASSPYFPRRTRVPSFEPDLSLPVNGYPSPSSSNAPSTPPLSLYASSLIDEDLSSGITSNSNGISGGIDIDPNLYLNSPIGLASPVSGKVQQHPWDCFGMVPLAPNPPVPIMQMDRNRSASLPTQFTPPRSVPSLSSTPAPSGTRNRAPTTSSIVHPSTTNFGNSSSSSNSHDLWDIKTSGVDLCNPSIDNSCHAFMSPINMHTELSSFAANKTELHACAEQGDSHGVQLLLSCGAHIDAMDEFGRTPLHYAVLNNHLDLTRILVQQGAITTIADINGLNPMQIAAESDSREMRQMMHMMIMMTPPLLVPGA